MAVVSEGCSSRRSRREVGMGGQWEGGGVDWGSEVMGGLLSWGWAVSLFCSRLLCMGVVGSLQRYGFVRRMSWVARCSRI